MKCLEFTNISNAVTIVVVPDTKISKVLIIGIEFTI